MGSCVGVGVCMSGCGQVGGCLWVWVFVSVCG